MTGSDQVGRTGVRPVVVLVGVLLLAANLRAALAAYPPLLQTVRAELDLTAGTAGLVQACSVLMMGVGSFLAPRLARRPGWERALGIAVLVVGAGSLLRLVPANAALISGGLLIGGGIGAAGVLLTGVVKHHLADRAGTVTGAYVVSMMIGATLASAVTVPLAVTLGGWSRSLAVWSIPAVLAVAAWWPVARRSARAEPPNAARSSGAASSDAASLGADDSGAGAAGAVPGSAVTERRGALPWRDGFARLAATYMAMSSVQFYGWLTWLSPYYESLGWAPQHAALLQALWSVVQIPAALLISSLAERRRRWTFWSALSLACGVAGTAGALWWPLGSTMAPGVGPWVWAGLMAVGVGAGYPLGLSLIAWRTRDGAAAGAASALALGVGYVCAAAAPLLIGVLLDLTGGYRLPLGLLLVAGAIQASAIVALGRHRSAGS